MRILVVEDDRRIAGFLQKGLEESGYHVAVAHDGEAGFLDASCCLWSAEGPYAEHRFDPDRARRA